MKKIQLITKLATLAKVRAEYAGPKGTGIAEQGNYVVQYEKSGLAGDTAILYHHGTPTAEVWLTNPASIISVYGQSMSDANSVNTFLEHHGIATRYTLKSGRLTEVK